MSVCCCSSFSSTFWNLCQHYWPDSEQFLNKSEEINGPISCRSMQHWVSAAASDRFSCRWIAVNKVLPSREAAVLFADRYAAYSVWLVSFDIWVVVSPFDFAANNDFCFEINGITALVVKTSEMDLEHFQAVCMSVWELCTQHLILTVPPLNRINQPACQVNSDSLGG